jgi:hypothetical protein
MTTDHLLAASFSAIALTLALTAPASARADDEAMEHHHHAKPAATSEPLQGSAQARLAMLKTMAGTWTGKARHGSGEPMDATVIWSVTGGGTAVTERLFPGTAHEMMTVYTVDGDDLVLTHYCAAGNQPSMKARAGGDPRTIAFDFTRGANMKPTDQHMHSAVLTFAGDDRFEADWTSYGDGKPAGVAHFALSRQKTEPTR